MVVKKMYKYRNRRQVLHIFEELRNRKHIKKFLDILRVHHRETYEHSLRVAKLSIDLAIENHFHLRIVKMIGNAALLHDFGKTRIDEKILSKNGPLDEKELSIMSKHPRLADAELKKFLPLDARRIIVSHHEFKAKPYPRKFLERREGIRPVVRERRRRNLIEAFTQIVAAADMYDALTFSRSYKSGFPLERVREIMIDQFTGKPILIAQLVTREVRKTPETKS